MERSTLSYRDRVGGRGSAPPPSVAMGAEPADAGRRPNELDGAPGPRARANGREIHP
jgi:hypothetical protein